MPLKLWISALPLTCLMLGCAPNRPNEHEAHYRSTPFADHRLHYIERGNPHKPLVLFIHGTPGSSAGFDAYLSDPRLLDAYHLIAVDRLGFGRSAASGAVASFDTHSRSLESLWARNKSAVRALVVGHSLGGSIAYRVALDYPDEVGGLLAISAAADPTLSTPRWYNHAANMAVVRWLVPYQLKVANVEMMPLAQELSLTAEHLHRLDIPVTIVQGAKDALVAAPNADFAASTINNGRTRVLHMQEHGHFIVWEEHGMMVDEILALAKTLPPRPEPAAGSTVEPFQTVE
ncbi:MAG: alpha/beta hydrolase [Pseudomonadota bacterium]